MTPTSQPTPRKTIQRLALYAFMAFMGYTVLVRLGFLFPVQLLPEVLCLPSCDSPQALHPEHQVDPLVIAPIDSDLGDSNSLGSETNNRQAIAELLPTDFEPDQVTVLIEKSEHRLTVFYELNPIKSYPVVFGKNAIGDKRNEGDRKTPEGIFRIRDQYPHPSWSKFLWLDYPTSQSWRHHFGAKLSGQINWFLPIGGEIGIHGVPPGGDDLIESQTNWTWGCPSMKNEDVDELYSVVNVGTVVEILP